MTNVQITNNFILNFVDQKKSVDAKFSLRAFARDTGIEQSNLSKILKGKRKLNPVHMSKIIEAYNLTEAEISKLNS